MIGKGIPKHIAIIMDGNGRWAEKRGLPRFLGHKIGIESVREIVKTCSEIGVEYLTLYTFSKENWRRPAEEVKFLMSLLKNLLLKEVEDLSRQNVQINAIGEIEDLPKEVRKVLKDAIKKTEGNTGLKLYLALSYSGREELLRVISNIVKKVEVGELKTDAICEDTVRRHLYAPELPDPDLLIRTSGEMRLSNFLLWQIAYTEIYVTDTFWPDFRREELLKAVENYRKRDRRFGGLNSHTEENESYSHT